MQVRLCGFLLQLFPLLLLLFLLNAHHYIRNLDVSFTLVCCRCRNHWIFFRFVRDFQHSRFFDFLSIASQCKIAQKIRQNDLAVYCRTSELRQHKCRMDGREREKEGDSKMAAEIYSLLLWFHSIDLNVLRHSRQNNPNSTIRCCSIASRQTSNNCNDKWDKWTRENPMKNCIPAQTLSHNWFICRDRDRETHSLNTEQILIVVTAYPTTNPI